MSLKFVLSVIKFFVGGAQIRVRAYVWIIVALKEKHKLLAKIVSNRLQKVYGVYLPPTVCFDNSLNLPHPVSIVVGAGAKIGRKVVIFQNVTIGGARLGDARKSNYPEIGDNTIIYAGAVIVGAVKIGSNCVVGANSVVVNDVPDNSTVAGVPARVIKRG